MIVVRHQGDFDKLTKFLRLAIRNDHLNKLEGLARQGVEALASSTPVDSGLTASSWGYEIHRSLGTYTIQWTNNNQNKSVNIAIILQYGHGTGTGGYVQGRDYINPSMRPVFDNIANEAWKVVTSL